MIMTLYKFGGQLFVYPYYIEDEGIEEIEVHCNELLVEDDEKRDESIVAYKNGQAVMRFDGDIRRIEETVKGDSRFLEIETATFELFVEGLTSID